MVKQTIFESDTDTLLRFSKHLDKLTSDDSIGVASTTTQSEYTYPLQTAPINTCVLKQDTGAPITGIESSINCTCLNLETLKCFEVVENQYEELGVTFSNCIAIQPSNPAFPTYSGAVVLMGAPKGGFLEVEFARPVNSVSARVTSSQRLLMSAYNREQKIVAQDVLSVGNLANSDSVVAPNALLSVKSGEIHGITFCAFDGQFTVDNFSFCS